jgi:thioredoxin reductase
MEYEVIVVGGSFAGMSAAMQLARARKRILLVDAGQPRNRFAEASHGFLGQDGVAPAAIMREALRQLSAYPSVDFVHGRADRAAGAIDRFSLTLESGQEVAARRLVLATGVTDELPAVDGLAERWGRTVLHCPYCHGYEVRDRPLGVLANNPMSGHQAVLIADWGPTTFFTQGAFEIDAETAAQLAAREVRIETTSVVGLIGEAPGLSGVRLADGRSLPIEAIFTAPKTRPAGGLADQLGCALEDGMTGPYLRVDGLKQTSVAGVFAAGDAVMAMHNATLAAAAGVMAGVSAHRSLFA